MIGLFIGNCAVVQLVSHLLIPQCAVLMRLGSSALTMRYDYGTLLAYNGVEYLYGVLFFPR
jgi:hypothetical protein